MGSLFCVSQEYYIEQTQLSAFTEKLTEPHIKHIVYMHSILDSTHTHTMMRNITNRDHRYQKNSLSVTKLVNGQLNKVCLCFF